MILKDDQFCKPKLNSGPTRYLYCAGIGHEFNSDINKLVLLFSKFGELDYSNDVFNNTDDHESNNEELNSNNDTTTGCYITNAICMVPNRRFIYVTYLTVQSAENAMKCISDSRPEELQEYIDSVNKLSVRYAEKKSNLAKLINEIECTSSTDHIHIPGCVLINDFIDEYEENQLLQELAGEDCPAWKENLSRRVQHYGFPFNYRTLMLDYSKPTLPLPESAQFLASKMMTLYTNSNHLDSTTSSTTSISSSYDSIIHNDSPLNQLTINEYLPGQGIASHRDTETCFGPVIFILNLGSAITMNFTKCGSEESATTATTIATSTTTTTASEENDTTSIRKYLYLPVRSLLILTGEARYQWTHGISPRRKDKIPYDNTTTTTTSSVTTNAMIPSTNSNNIDENIIQNTSVSQSNNNVTSVFVNRGRRISLTFRHALRPGSLPPIQLYSNELELDHVVRVYDNIAVHWNHTRGKRKVYWHRVKDFIDSLPAGTLLADIGSGDGKYFGVNPDIISIGCDRSLKLLEVSHDKAYESFCCDAVKLPLTSDTFDATLCIAVLHHLSTIDRRYAVISELLRITKPGGTVLIQAWALEQKGLDYESKRVFEDQDTMVPWRLNKRFLIPNTLQVDNENNSTNSKLSNTTTTTNMSTSFSSFEDNHPHRIKLPEVGDSGPCQHVTEEHGDLVFQRYCHVYKEGELEGICSSIPGCKLIESGWDKGNWFVRLEKTHDERLVTIKQGPESRIPILVSRK